MPTVYESQANAAVALALLIGFIIGFGVGQL